MTIFQRRIPGRPGHTLAIAATLSLVTILTTACTQLGDTDTSAPKNASAEAKTSPPASPRRSSPADMEAARQTPAPTAAPQQADVAPSPTPDALPKRAASIVPSPTPKPSPTPRPLPTPLPVDAPIVAQPDISKLEPVVQQQLRQAQDAVAADPSDAQNVGLLGALFHAYGLLPAAAAEYQSAVRIAPDEFKWHYLLAQTLMDLNILPEAATQFERAMELNPDYVATHIALANVYMRLEQFDKALDLMVKARERQPDSPIINYTLGMAYMGLDEPVFAIQYFKPILDANPQFGAVRAMLAQAFRNLGQQANADALLEEFAPNSASPSIRDPVLMSIYHEATGTEAERLKGGAYLSAGDFARALEHFEMALTFSPDDRGATIGLADCLAGLRRYDRAEKVLRGILEKEPDDVIARVGLAQLAIAQGQFDRAESIVEDINTDGPDAPPILQLKVHIAIARDDEPAALRALGELAGVESTNAVIYFNLAQVYFSVGRVDQAERALKKTIELDPDHALAYQALGDITWQRGQREAAIDWYRQAVIRRADLSRACNRVAMHALENKHFEVGRTILERCHEATPNDLDIADTLARVYALSPDPAVRDGQKAHQLARVVYARAGADSIRALHTLAAANAELGDFAEAQRLMERAVELAANMNEAQGTVTVTDLQAALDAYKQQRHLYDAAP